MIEREVPGRRTGEVRLTVEAAPCTRPTSCSGSEVRRGASAVGAGDGLRPGWSSRSATEVSTSSWGNRRWRSRPWRPEAAPRRSSSCPPRRSSRHRAYRAGAGRDAADEQADRARLELLGLVERADALRDQRRRRACVLRHPIAKTRGPRVLADAFGGRDARRRLRCRRLLHARRVVAAIHDEAPDGVDAVCDTAMLGGTCSPRSSRGSNRRRGGPGTATTSSRESGSRTSGRDGGPPDRTGCRRYASWRCAASGAPVAGTYPPERAADAQRRTEAGGLRGRAVIVFT